MHSKTYLEVVCTVASMSALFVLHADSILSAHWRLESSNCKPRSSTATNTSECHVQLARGFSGARSECGAELLDLQIESPRLKQTFQALVADVLVCGGGRYALYESRLDQNKYTLEEARVLEL